MRTRIPLAAVVVALLAACTAAPPDERTAAEVLWGPLQRLYLDVKEGSEEDFTAQVNEIEEQIAACMAGLGFEYVPAPSNYARFGAEQLLEGPLPGSEEYAQEYGYGMVRVASSEVSGTEDPNEEIRAGLSSETLAEYEIALFGDYSLWENHDEPPPPEMGGCQREATVALWSGEIDPFEDEIQAELTRIDSELVPRDERVTALDTKWAACMADAGYPGHQDPRTTRDGMWELYLEHGGGEGTVGSDGMTDSERTFLEIEIPQAVADWQCRDAIDYDSVAIQVRDELQQQFIDSHQAELDAWSQRVQEADAR